MWFDEHDEWVEQFTEFMDTHEPDENDQMFASNLAAKVRRGDISMHRAVHELMSYVASKMGYLGFHDEEAFDLEMRYRDMVEITEELYRHLEVVGEPGIANAIIRAYASMKLFDESAESIEAGIGLHCKAWFNLARLTKEEDEHFKWAVIASLKERYGGQI